MKTRLSLLAPLLLCTGLRAFAADPDILLADFEGESYGDWKAEGEAFGSAPARGTLPGQMRVEGYLGKGLVNSFRNGDKSTGTLTSPPFTIQRPNLQFLIGGGGFAGQTCMNLLVEGKVVRTATGPNTAAGGSEKLDWQQWNVAEFGGKTATIQIVDAATGGWGHINVDQILQTDRKIPQTLENVSRTLALGRRYLNIPIRNGAPTKTVSISVDGQLLHQNDVELADEAPDWWASVDLGASSGRDALVTVDKLREDSAALKSIRLSDAPLGRENLYGEKLRPQFHFSPARGWNNDPNGLVFYEGRYHMFYQHNPYGWNWGNMHWGHAVSEDLVHWRELPIALYPDRFGSMFSGSAVVDEGNTAGFKSNDHAPLVCVFTAAGGTTALSKKEPFTQGIAYSTDGGASFMKYANNPVLRHIVGGNRDPKVIWHAPDQKWVMALYLDKNDYALFSSSDLKKWDKLSDVNLPGVSECPEFFEIQSARGKLRWVFYGGNGNYLVGSFDGKQFTPEAGPFPLHRGNCFYASQTFNGLKPANGRRILVPWGTLASPGMPFNQMLGIPVELTLRETEDGPRLFSNPVSELASLRLSTEKLGTKDLTPGENPLAAVGGELLDLTATIAPGASERIDFVIRGITVSYTPKTKELSCLDKKAPLKLVDGAFQLRILVDRTTLDIFGNGGECYMPMGVAFKEGAQNLSLLAQGSGASVRALEVSKLKSAW